MPVLGQAPGKKKSSLAVQIFVTVAFPGYVAVFFNVAGKKIVNSLQYSILLLLRGDIVQEVLP